MTRHNAKPAHYCPATALCLQTGSFTHMKQRFLNAPNAVVNCAKLANVHIQRKSKPWMSVERFLIGFGLTGAGAEPCSCFPVLPFTLDPESSSVLILNTSDCCSLDPFLPFLSAAEVPNFLNIVLKTLVCPIILVQMSSHVS